MRVLISGVNFEFAQLFIRQRPPGHHPFDCPTNDFYRFLFQHFLGRSDFQTTGIMRIVLIFLLFPFLTGKVNFFRVHHDDIVASIAMGRVVGFVFAAEQVRDRYRQTANDEVGRVDQNPLRLNRRRVHHCCGHDPSIRVRLGRGVIPKQHRSTAGRKSCYGLGQFRQAFAAERESIRKFQRIALYQITVCTHTKEMRMTPALPGVVQEYPTFGLPAGSVRGFLSVLICSFFWILLLLPPDYEMRAPLGHFFLLTMVLMAFVSHPLPQGRTHLLPWLMRVLFVGGSLAVVVWALIQDPQLAAKRLTPAAEEVYQWPVLLGCLTGGFAVALFLRFILGRTSQLFMTLRAWVGVLAMLLLLFETILQYVILPNISERNLDVEKIWEGILIAIVSGYFGTRV